jgi:LPS O-antigen subunit length determinant protein (WzzB/FepE family)
MKLKRSKVMIVPLAIMFMAIALLLGTLKNEYYENEYITIHAPLPSADLATLKMDLDKQGIFKKIGQPRKLYLRLRKLHNTSNKAMGLKFALDTDNKSEKISFKINSKPFDIQEQTFELAAGEKANFNLYLNISKDSYEKGDWKGNLLIKDINQNSELVGTIPIEIINSRSIL